MGSVTKEELIDMKVLDEDGTYYHAPPIRLSYAPKHMIEEDGLYLSNQQEMVEGLDPEGHYPTMWFFAGNGPESYWGSPGRAYFLLDDIMRACLQGVMMRTHHGVLAPEADGNFTSLWICLSELFCDSRVTMCKTCDLPIIANKERGAKRLYCNDTCKRKYKRALKFVSLVTDGGMDH